MSESFRRGSGLVCFVRGLIACMSLSWGGGVALAADEGPAWSRDFASASTQAREAGKCVLVLFTRPDCSDAVAKMRKAVFSQEPFVSYAREHLVFVLVDFPEREPQSLEERRQNRALREKFAPASFPTVVLLAQDGRELGRLGYVHGGPKGFVRLLRTWAEKPAAPSTSQADPSHPVEGGEAR